MLQLASVSILLVSVALPSDKEYFSLYLGPVLNLVAVCATEVKQADMVMSAQTRQHTFLRRIDHINSIPNTSLKTFNHITKKNIGTRLSDVVLRYTMV